MKRKNTPMVGFTLIELFVVIAIIAISAAILFPVSAQARVKTRQTSDLSKQNPPRTKAMLSTTSNNPANAGAALDGRLVLGLGSHLFCVRER